MKNNVLVEPLLANIKIDRDSVSEGLQQILHSIRTYLDMDVAFIAEFSDGRRVFKYIDAKDNSFRIKAGDSNPLNETYCYKIAQGELPEHIVDTSKNPITEKLKATKALSIRHYMGVPIRLSDGSIYGIFCCFNYKTDESIRERDLTMLHIFADFAGKQIDNTLKKNRKKKEMSDRITAILDPSRINMVYQPIYNIEKEKITSYESTLRIMSTPYRTPDVWIQEAIQVGLGEQLEIMAIEKAIKDLEKLPEDTAIAINTSPELIINGAIARVLENVPAKRIIPEITEHAPIADYATFRTALKPLRQQGIRLAIDDAGAGYASFQHILEIAPDFIKLDTSIIQSIDNDPARRALATAIISFAKETGTKIIAEGVETDAEFNELKRLGVNIIQGFYIGHPMSIADAVTLQKSPNHKPQQHQK